MGARPGLVDRLEQLGLLRVGSEWALALLYPDAEGRNRRSAILNTLIAAAVVAFWFYMRRRSF